jgi:hypothetical protein
MTIFRHARAGRCAAPAAQLRLTGTFSCNESQTAAEAKEKQKIHRGIYLVALAQKWNVLTNCAIITADHCNVCVWKRLVNVRRRRSVFFVFCVVWYQLIYSIYFSFSPKKTGFAEFFSLEPKIRWIQQKIYQDSFFLFLSFWRFERPTEMEKGLLQRV